MTCPCAYWTSRGEQVNRLSLVAAPHCEHYHMQEGCSKLQYSHAAQLALSQHRHTEAPMRARPKILISYCGYLSIANYKSSPFAL